MAALVTPSIAPADSLAALRQEFGLSREKFARLLGVSAKTVERWEGRVARPSGDLAGQRLAQLLELADLGHRVLDTAGFARFLDTPQPSLRYRTPLALIERGEAEAVIGVLASLDAGTGY